jgi:UDP-N-acetylmuramoyl-L-alanyl-D-glutamate--2,6-diaminopimelate ligase
MSSEAVPQYRHKFIYLDALIFTNLAPEHIESHGSYENYVKAKLEIAKILETTPKKNPAIVVNTDDKEAEKFLGLNIKNKVPYSLADAFNVHSDQNGSSFQINKTVIHSPLAGEFNVMNMLGAITMARFLEIPDEIIKKGLETIPFIRGRMEKIDEGQSFDVVVDYAHTPESLKAIYETYKNHETVCVLGNTGGGRDKWKRKEMGKIANEYCSQIILTNEDPYDEDPRSIVDEMKKEITDKPCDIIMDRRTAIFTALNKAKDIKNAKAAVLITGKGTDPHIMGPHGTRQEWDDATIAREELQKLI